MLTSFRCPSCSAPLTFTGAVTQKCGHCGGTVIAPHEMFYAAKPNAFDDLSGLEGRALKIAEVQRLIHSGNKIQAIKVFREAFGAGLKDAKDAVEAIERGESVDVSSFKVVQAPSTPATAHPQKKPEFRIDIDHREVKRAAKTVGTIAFVIIFVTIFATVGAVALGFYFAFSSSDREPALSTGPARTDPVPKGAESSPLAEVMKIGGEGNGEGRFKDNRHVAVDGKGRIYSSDYSPIRIQVFDADGKFVSQWKPEDGSNLYGLAVSRDGELFIASNRGVFKYEGGPARSWERSTAFIPAGSLLAGTANS